MLSRKKQRKYLAKKSREWQNHLHAYRLSGNPETLHKLRIAVKKIKAIARFSKACIGGPDRKEVGGLKEMYRQAGAIRDAGNQLQLLGRLPAVPQAFLDEQKGLQEEATTEFLRHVKRYRRKGKRAVCRLLAAVDSIDIHRIRDWYAMQLISIGVHLIASRDDLHKARKQIKELLYVLNLLPSRLVAGLHLDTDYLQRLQEAIGQWHDAAGIPATIPGATAQCEEKETAVRDLAAEFYWRVHKNIP